MRKLLRCVFGLPVFGDVILPCVVPVVVVWATSNLVASVSLIMSVYRETCEAAAGARVQLTAEEQRDPKKFGEWLERNVPK